MAAVYPMSRPAALAVELLALGAAALTLASYALPAAFDFALWAWRNKWKT